MSEEAKGAMQINSYGASQQPFLIQGVGSTLNSGAQLPGTITGSGAQGAMRIAGTNAGASQQRMLEMMDEKQILQYEIEQEKDKLMGKEKKQREALETQRKMH